MDIDDALVRCLAELAFIAGAHRMTDRNLAIVGALEALRPDSERPALILALSQMHLGDAPGAERILREQALRRKPDSAMALAYLALALHQQKRIGERDQVARAALEAGAVDGDADAAALAQELLDTRF